MGSILRGTGLLAAVLVSLSPTPTDAGERSVISLNSQAIDTSRPDAVPEGLRATAGERGAEYVLVKFPGPVSAKELQALRGAAARVYTYLPDDAFLVRMDESPDRAARLAELGASWSGTYHPFYKLSRFLARHIHTKTLPMRNERPLVTFTFDDVPASACSLGAPLLEQHGARGTFYVCGGGCGAESPGASAQRT